MEPVDERRWQCGRRGSIRLCILLVAFSLAITAAAPGQTNLASEHFYWSGIPTQAQVSQPFIATVRASSSGTASDTNFNGTVAVSELVAGQKPGVLITEVQTVNTNRVELSNLSTSTLDLSGWRLFFYDSASWPAPKMAFSLPTGTLCASSGVFEVRASGFAPGAYPVFYAGVGLSWNNLANNPIAVLLEDAKGEMVDFFCSGTAFTPYITFPGSIPTALWNGPPIAAAVGANLSLTYQRRGHSDHATAADWVLATNTFGVINPGLVNPLIGTATPFATAPSTVTLTNGIWSGQLKISTPATNAFLRADDGAGLPGDSSPFTVLPLPSLEVTVPHAAFKASAGLVGQGEISIPVPLSSDLPVVLSSSLTNEIAVPPGVVISIGATNASFVVSNLNNGQLEGPVAVSIIASAAGFTAGSDVITNYDAGAPSVSVSLPSLVLETGGWLTSGRVNSSAPVSVPVAVHLSSSNSQKLQVPDFAVILPGQTTASFSFAVFQNPYIDGNQTVTVTANVPGWASGQAHVQVIDNKGTNLTLTLPSPVNAGAGTLTNAGKVQIGGLLSTDLLVTLSNSLPAKLQLPSAVTVPAGQTSAVFNIQVPGDTLLDGNQTAVIVASAGGFTSASRGVGIIDNEVYDFSFSILPPSQLANQPFLETIYALNSSGSVVPGYSGSAILQAIGAEGKAPLAPGTVGPFTNGVWSGMVTFSGESRSTILSVGDGVGHGGQSSSFDVVGGYAWPQPISDFAYDALRQQILATFPATAVSNSESIIALNPYNGTVRTTIQLGRNFGCVALSGDDQYLYVAENTLGKVGRFALNTWSEDLLFAADTAGTVPYTMFVSPGNPHRLVAWLDGGQGLAEFQDGIRSTNIVLPDPAYRRDPNTLVFYDSPTNFYSISASGPVLSVVNLATSGPNVIPLGPSYAGGQLSYEGGLLFSSMGDVYDPVNLRHLGSYPTNGLEAANANLGQVYFVSGSTILVFDLTTLNFIGQIDLPISPGSATKMISCGTNGLAIATTSELLVVQSDLFAAPALADLSVWQSTPTNTAVTGSNFIYSITVSNAGPGIATNVVLADLLPADSVFVSATNSRGGITSTNGILRCPLGVLAPGASLTTAMVIQGMTPGTINNLAWAIGDGINLTNGVSRQANAIVFGPVLPAVTRLWLDADYVDYDSARNYLWLTTEYFGGALEQNIRSIDLASGIPHDSYSVGYPMGKLTFSSSQNYLYALYVNNQDGLNYTPDNYVRRLNLVSKTFDQDFLVTDAVGQEDTVLDMSGISSYPDDILIAGAGPNDDVALYQNGKGTRRTSVYYGSGTIEVNPNIPTRVYLDAPGLDAFNFGPTSLTLIGSLGGYPSGPIRFANGRLFSIGGAVADPETLTNITDLPVPRTSFIQADPAMGLVYYLIGNAGLWTLEAFDTATLEPAWSYVVPGLLGVPVSMARCGPGIVAISTDANQLFILNTALLPHDVQTDLALTETETATSAITNVPITFTTTIVNDGPSAALNVSITNRFPPDATIFGVSSSQGVATNMANTIVCSVGNLPLGSAAWLQVVASLNHAGILTDQASVGQNAPDLAATNSVGSASVAFSLQPLSALSILEQVPALPPVVGSNFVYTLVISNAGPNDATNVNFSDQLTAGGTVESFTNSQGSLTTDGTSTYGSLGYIASGSSATVTLILKPCCVGLFPNTAIVNSENQDPNPENDQIVFRIPTVNPPIPPVAEEITIPTEDIAYDAARQQILLNPYMTVPYSNGIVGMDVVTGGIDKFIPAGNVLGQLGVSDDYRYLYAGMNDTGGVARIDLESNAVDLRFPLTSPATPYVPNTAEQIAVMPGHPTTIAAAGSDRMGISGIALYDVGVQRTNTLTVDGYFRLGFIDETNLAITSPSGFEPAVISASGVTNGGALISGENGDFAIDGGMVFLNTGQVLDGSSGASLGTFPAVGPVLPDLANGRVYFLTGAGQGGYYWFLTVRAFDPNSKLELFSVPFSSYIGNALHLISLGTNGLAFLTDANRVFVVRTPQLAVPASDLSITQSASPVPVSSGAPLTYNLTVRNLGPWTATGVVVSNTIPSGSGFVSATSSQGICIFTNGSLICTLGRMINGAAATVTVTTTAGPAGPATNSASVFLNGYDPSLSNNSTNQIVSVTSEPTMNVADAIGTQGTAIATISFPVSLSGPSSTSVSVGYSTADGTAVAGHDYKPTSGLIKFNPGNTIGQLNLAIILTNYSSRPENYFFINLGPATNAILARTQAVATIVQRDFYGVSISGVTLQNRGADTNAQFLLTSWPPNSVPVSVQYQTVDGTAIAGADYAPREGILTFAAGATNVILSVPVFGNSSADALKTFSVLLSDPQNAILTADEAQGTIFDDSLIGPVVISGAQFQGSNILVQFNSIAGRYYRLQRSDNPAFGSWTTIVDNLPANGSLMTVSDTLNGAASARFYRLVLLP